MHGHVLQSVERPKFEVDVTEKCTLGVLKHSNDCFSNSPPGVFSQGGKLVQTRLDSALEHLPYCYWVQRT
jgi:hypothetical protein